MTCLRLAADSVRSRLSVGHKSRQPLPQLRDLDQPFPFNITLRRQSLRLEFFDTASPQNFTLLQPAIVILCYSIANPDSLFNLKAHWKTVLETHFGHDEALPVIVLGLQRDVRREEDYDGRVRRFAADDQTYESIQHSRSIVYPQEALRVAGEMRCDRYCECSAMTGDLCLQVIEDIAETALATTTAQGGKSSNPHCCIM